eukprot:TRINITY_DN7627_c0_g1_i1.p1 TRINITY_DN7627_c0_g1~~TRINITY_DN7627_c0_g1_i1.p1  ORF type:complete len:383 (+),score=98.34 TRINITY_DN7627_c0_g1_i1:49-1197(+)
MSEKDNFEKSVNTSDNSFSPLLKYNNVEVLSPNKPIPPIKPPNNKLLRRKHSKSLRIENTSSDSHLMVNELILDDHTAPSLPIRPKTPPPNKNLEKLVQYKNIEKLPVKITITSNKYDNNISPNGSNDKNNTSQPLFINTNIKPSSRKKSKSIISKNSIQKLQKFKKKLFKKGLMNLIKDRTHNLKRYKSVITGCDMVQFLMEKGKVNNMMEAVEVGNQMIFFDLMHHVDDELNFKNEYIFYRFREHESSTPRNNRVNIDDYELQLAQVDALKERLFKKGFRSRIKESILNFSFTNVFLSSDLIDFMITNKEARDVSEAIQLGNLLLDFDFIHHINDQHNFKNEYLFYKFRDDEVKEPAVGFVGLHKQFGEQLENLKSKNLN